MTPHDFLSLLWQYKPEDQYILLWTWPDKRSCWFLDPAKAAEFAASTGQQKDVYVGVGCSKQQYGPARRCKSDEITGLAGIGTDLDLLSQAHKKALPATIPDALKIVPAAMPPSIIVSTGNGLHPWWLFKEPLNFENDAERQAAARLLTRWHKMLELNAAAHGWTYDKLADLARILRIPGTRNLKDPKNPKDVTVLSVTDRRYNFSDFEEFLGPDVEGGAPKDQAALPPDWKQQFEGKHLIVDLRQRISQDRIDGWMHEDPRFRATWLKQRYDMEDTSQSGYDLALACFGVDAGLSEQEIITLIVHHRSLYARTHRTKIDYFERTIATAMRKTGGVPAPMTAEEAETAIAQEIANGHAAMGDTAFSDAPASPPSTTGPVAPHAAPVAPEQPQAANTTVKALSPEEKDKLCAELAKLLRTPIVKFRKIKGKEPTYQIVLADGSVIDIAGFGKFTNQQVIYEAIGNATNEPIPHFKPALWEEVKRRMLKACYIEEPTDEEDLVRGARMHIVNYLRETGFIASIEEERVQNQRKPIILDDGRIAVSTLDFRAYLIKTTCENVSPRQAASMLVAVGGTEHRVKGQGYDQIRRALPYPEFDPKKIRPEEAIHVVVQ
ncbi:MAG TPA: hypothetical protein VFA33_04970 [Bryobacteraceae bacterium]|nr:hypothetical protein [Bryobacteraceae bacterium]